MALKAPTAKTVPKPPATAQLFSWDDLAQYKAEGRFLDGYPSEWRTFWSPRDRVHGLLVALLSSAQHSIVLNMFGYDDAELDAIIRSKLADEDVYVQMSLDKRQSRSTKTEQAILKAWSNETFGNSIAIGTSAVKGAISHLKIVIVDGVYTVRGSTNWSLSGETQQDNELTLSRNAVIAAETRAVLDLNHDWMLKQMAKSRQATSGATKKTATNKTSTKKGATKKATSKKTATKKRRG
jgi:phosphatidylserine/phosphatidylglycerophosphate/cardiolipin synthase-like enzyme